MARGSRMVLKKNDRIVFLGDSITEQQMYTNYVESYLTARYPEYHLTFFNAGWGGDTAPGGLRRLERDVLSLKPSVVTICYGMNDGQYVAPSDEIFQNFVAGMNGLVARLKKARVRVVLLTPGFVDVTVNPNAAKVDYNNKGLRILADYVLKLARREKLPVYDLNKLMTEVDRKAKQADKTFNMAPDSVHPDPAGHLVMAYGLLHALGVPPRRQEIRIDVEKGTIKTGPGVRAGRLERGPYGFAFDMRLDRVPFYVEPAARKVLPFLPFQETFNQLQLSARGLKARRCYFRSEASRTDSLPKGQLARGINLFSQWALKPVQQAAAVYRFTLEKDQAYFKMWRQLGLNGVNGEFYNAAAHKAGIEAVPALDRARQSLLGADALRFRVNLISTNIVGEPLDSGDFISQWNLRGTFPKPFAKDRLGGEAAFSASIPSVNGEWIAPEVDIQAPGNSLCQIFGPVTECFAYAATVIDSPLAQSAELLVGSDDGFAVWLNGQPLLDRLAVARGLTIDQDRVPVQLRAGKNVLLLKLSQEGGGWGFCARFAGLKKPVAALRLKAANGR